MVPASVLASWLSAKRDASPFGLSPFSPPAPAPVRRQARERREEIRRAVYLGCRVKWVDRTGLVGDRSLNLSPRGIFVLSDEEIPLGTDLFVSFRTTELPIWFDTQATVTRLIAGRRLGDDGRGFGMRFRTLPGVSRLILRGYLRRAPRPAPQRAWPVPAPAPRDPDYAQLVRDIWDGRC
jgi:hypothetical protein